MQIETYFRKRNLECHTLNKLYELAFEIEVTAAAAAVGRRKKRKVGRRNEVPISGPRTAWEAAMKDFSYFAYLLAKKFFTT